MIFWCKICRRAIDDNVMAHEVSHFRVGHKEKNMTPTTCCGRVFIDETALSHHVDSHHKEMKMDDQMEQVWRSKDGVVTGSREEVEAYLKNKNPLAKMHFPYDIDHPQAGMTFVSGHRDDLINTTRITSERELKAVAAFANLAPLIQSVLDHFASDWRTYHYAGPLKGALQNLDLAYEEALKQVPQ